MNRRLLKIVFVLLLTGCLPSNQSGVINDANESSSSSGSITGRVYHDKEHKYMVTIPEQLPRWTTWSEDLDSPTFPRFTTSETELNTVVATIFYPSGSCSSALSSTAKTSAISNSADHFLWEEVKPVSIFVQPPPPCQPPMLNGHEDPDPLITGSREFGYAYALCSEKEGVTVLICISQMGDNPQLAEQIFKTFRWIDTEE